MSRFFSGSQKGSPRYSFGEAGFSQVVLLVLLVVGLVAAVYGVQYARTVMNPQASEIASLDILDDEVTLADCYSNKSYEYCDASSGNMKRVSFRLTETRDDNDQVTGNSCSRDIEDSGISCSSYYCADNLVYCDNVHHDPAILISKHSGVYDVSDPAEPKCVYIYDQVKNPDDGQTVLCSVGPTYSKNPAHTDNTWYTNRPGFKNPAPYIETPDPQETRSEGTANYSGTGNFCEPGTRNQDSCALCNSQGTAWNESGTDWGLYDGKTGNWCGCARQYSTKIQNMSYNSTNYPQCFGPSEQE